MLDKTTAEPVEAKPSVQLKSEPVVQRDVARQINVILHELRELPHTPPHIPQIPMDCEVMFLLGIRMLLSHATYRWGQRCADLVDKFSMR